ncbi:MAG: hypothetical protein FJ009_04305 [Chloroflexi bacterium]|nr:hypothetical protein [Chloroflexota bacterium]
MTIATKQNRLRPRRVADMTPDELCALIEKMIDRKLANGSPAQPKSKITPAMRQRAISAAGRFRSGRADVSRQHD